MSANTKRRFRYEASDCDLRIEIDTSVLTSGMADDINQFLSNAAERLHTCDGDVYRVVGRLFALAAIGYMQRIGGASISDVSIGTDFVKSILRDQGEGWPRFEELGIQILEAYVPSIDFFDLDENEMVGEAA